jgi:hypothetical protein
VAKAPKMQEPLLLAIIQNVVFEHHAGFRAKRWSLRRKIIDAAIGQRLELFFDWRKTEQRSQEKGAWTKYSAQVLL